MTYFVVLTRMEFGNPIRLFWVLFNPFTFFPLSVTCFVTELALGVHGGAFGVTVETFRADLSSTQDPTSKTS